MTVPSLQLLHRSSSGQYLRVLIYTSAGLPQPFLRNLKMLADEIGCAEVLILEENEKFRYADAIPRTLFSMVDMSGDIEKLAFAAVRLDDDDALPTDYTDRLSQFIADSYSGFAISFGRGYVGRFDPQSQRFVQVRDTCIPMHSRGLAAICTYDKVSQSFCSPCSSAFQLGKHTTVSQRFPTIVDAREPGFFASEHPQQDTARLSLLRKFKQLTRQVSTSRHYSEGYNIKALREDNAFSQRFNYIPLVK